MCVCMCCFESNMRPDEQKKGRRVGWLDVVIMFEFLQILHIFRAVSIDLGL